MVLEFGAAKSAHAHIDARNTGDNATTYQMLTSGGGGYWTVQKEQLTLGEIAWSV